MVVQIPAWPPAAMRSVLPPTTRYASKVSSPYGRCPASGPLAATMMDWAGALSRPQSVRSHRRYSLNHPHSLEKDLDRN